MAARIAAKIKILSSEVSEICAKGTPAQRISAIITRGEKGAVVVNGRTKIFVEAEVVENAVDTTGAGDLYAAGFLYGMTQGRSLGTCAIIGSIAAAEVVTHYGARPEVSLCGLVRNKLLSYGKRP